MESQDMDSWDGGIIMAMVLVSIAWEITITEEGLIITVHTTEMEPIEYLEEQQPHLTEELILQTAEEITDLLEI